MNSTNTTNFIDYAKYQRIQAIINNCKSSEFDENDIDTIILALQEIKQYKRSLNNMISSNTNFY